MIFLYTSLIYIIVFGAFLQLLVEVKSQLITYKPDLRYAHTATLIEDKIYILGGAVPPPRTDYGISPKETFLYLDVSTPFSTNEVKYIDISNNNAVPSHRFAIATKGGANNSTLFLYGGDNLNNQTKELVYTFDAQHSTWSVPKITGDPDPPKGTSYMFPVIDYNELFYLFGGGGAPVVNYVNDMHILDTINLSWKKASSIGAPSNRDGYGAVFLPNKKIIYMGGYGPNGFLPLNEETDGIVPTPRASFSAVLGLDGQSVIIFGGSSEPPLSREIALYVLNLNKFRWRIPGISGKIPASRAFHNALLIGNYMVVTFGGGYMREDDNDILLLDISNNDEYAWTTSFVPPLPTSQSPTNSSSHSNINTIGVAIGILIGVIGGIALTVGGFFLYKQYKNRKERSKAISTPGNERINIKYS
ncbi:hypothetical protein GLOIN_2v1724489 [Rhizophagus irregularis DAOM 181602=DAOM 197198]|uniref:Galactose oxidase n=1 Tax=Rhizophagus irregularis (strain DAOM 181602 / DAOM 197198 / MUCL 43194) TaxID=747089 RepID=A0A2P4P184_RHIID|nr:hypothetical protein GLOIN_2v1724489 [Rhizophagus irregularis DAOM 181602=DAOM 197198]POG59159.1 hypothetical protein GLOIN_2v1724489 [Rhizophagus irregularis DAOM 181602=DAOM 197198]|eukprot:XP_025166025.1 hypothetical protein GLOIN_2v1724489 [Rhizophagus irregularis DAOM 181602=DAOM 197198]